MFTLGREDVFALDDLGLKQGVIKLYNLKETDKKILLKKIEKISSKWSPYRTYASRYLWNWKDNAPEPEKKKAAIQQTNK
jgi:DNA-3-methyladenine glycosylase II